MKKSLKTTLLLSLIAFLSGCMHAPLAPLNPAISRGEPEALRLAADQGADPDNAGDELDGFVRSNRMKYPNGGDFITEEKAALGGLQRYAQKTPPVSAAPAAPPPPAVSPASPPSAAKKDRPKYAVWDLAPLNINRDYARALTSILVSEISKLGKYEIYSQENVRTLAGWTAERMQFGCTDTRCLTALGQMDIAGLISGSVGRIGTTYSLSLNLFDTQNARAEKSISDFCKSEDDLISLVQASVRRLLGEEAPSPAGAVIKDPVTGMEFVFVKGGCYRMGDDIDQFVQPIAPHFDQVFAFQAE